jgi:hypothetical protein
MYTVHVLGIGGVWREYHVFASRAAAERGVIGFEAEGFRAKIYAVRPIEGGRKCSRRSSSPAHLGSDRRRLGGSRSRRGPGEGGPEPRVRRLLAGRRLQRSRSAAVAARRFALAA